jgi:ribonuclease Z
MATSVSAELVNGPLGDPALYLGLPGARRAVLFDVGDIGALLPRKILRLSDVFVSHAHMDHFSGLDRLVRVCLGRGAPVRLYGPPGFLERVEHKLAAYSWNLAGNYPGDFTLRAHEVLPDWTLRAAQFSSRTGFAREALPGASCPDGVLLEQPLFRVRAAFLDHGIPCLAFALEEKPHLKVRKDRLLARGLKPGAWLGELERAVAEGRAGPQGAELIEALPGEKVAYVTDIRYTAENQARVARLAAGADRLFIECVFLSSEAEHAARKNHLTAAQAGSIARAARAKAVIPFHFSPRYRGREAELAAELEAARGAP